MTSKRRNKRQALISNLFLLPDHCPNQYDWAKLHAEGTAVQFDHISLGPDNLTFTYEKRFVYKPHGIGRFVRMQDSDIGMTCYYSPTLRRAILYYGGSEPKGLMLFFIWHARFKQDYARIIEFLKIYHWMKAEIGWDLDSFLEINDIIGKVSSPNCFGNVANDVINNFIDQIETMVRQLDNQYGADCPQGQAAKMLKHLLDDSLSTIYRCRSTSESIKLLLALIEKIYELLNS